MNIITRLSIIGCLIALIGCEAPLHDVIKEDMQQIAKDAPTSSAPKGLDKAYWYAGEAEITKYDLSQYRYRDAHEGELVTIFVTEDFLTDKQVKNDNYTNKNSTPILKLNGLRRFTTGIYDYSMMTSVFTRADGSSTEKVTLSSQDWCGQSYVQLNKSGKGKYRIQLRSYFESEGDQDVKVSADLLEDEIPNLIRINPDLIPTGTTNVLPSLVQLRFSHDNMKSLMAEIKRTDNKDGTSTLSVVYPSDNRTVDITYDQAAPYIIRSWNEDLGSKGR